MSLIRLAFRNVFRHKKRSFATMGAISFGVACLIFVGGFFEDLFIKVRENSIYSQTGHIRIQKKGFREYGNLAPFDYLLNDYGPLISQLKKIPESQVLSPELYFGGFLSDGEKSVATICFGLDPDNKWAEARTSKGLSSTAEIVRMELGLLLVKGDSLAENDPSGIQVAHILAKNFGVDVGDGLIFLTRTAEGSINGQDVRIRGIISTGIDELDRMAVRMPLATAQKLVRSDGIHTIVGYLNKTEDTDRFKDQILTLAHKKGWVIDVSTWKDLNDFYWKTRTLFGSWSKVVKFIMGILIILIIFNTMNMVIFERTVEVGTLRAIGLKQKRIVQLFVLEGFFLGFLGGLGGVLLGTSLTMAVQKIGIPMPVAPGFSVGWVSEPLIVWQELVGAFFLALMTAILSSIIPAIKASRLDIATALRKAG